MTNPSELDPAIFTQSREADFSHQLISAAQNFSTASEIAERYERLNTAEAKEGRLRELKENEDYKAVSELLGTSLAMSFVDETVTEASSPVDKAEYAKAVTTRETSLTNLLGLVFGYEQYMENNLRPVFDNDEVEVSQAAWNATWTKLRETLHPVGGTALADIADFFDALIENKYQQFFDPTDRLRGPVVSQDISARTFYEAMEKHLSRAIMRRGEDGWSA